MLEDAGKGVHLEPERRRGFGGGGDGAEPKAELRHLRGLEEARRARGREGERNRAAAGQVHLGRGDAARRSERDSELKLERGLVAAFAALCRSQPRPAPGRRRPFPGFESSCEELSEEGGYFDTDNLISNETAYVQVIPDLTPSGRRLHRRRAGTELPLHRAPPARMGLHPRRSPRQSSPPSAPERSSGRVGDAQRLPLPALFATVRRRGGEGEDLRGDGGRGREAPSPTRTLFERNLEAVFEHIETRLGFRSTRRTGKVIEFTYRSFFDEQLGLRFKSHGRPPMPYHPTYRSAPPRDGTRRGAVAFPLPSRRLRSRPAARAGGAARSRRRGFRRAARLEGDREVRPRAGRDGHRLLRLERRVLSSAGRRLPELRRERPGASALGVEPASSGPTSATAIPTPRRLPATAARSFARGSAGSSSCSTRAPTRTTGT